jgi:TPP-dependent pyruvate/acetoin dehydrogenase alpha subunit
MHRHPPFDPPEYLTWRRDDALVRQYAATIAADPARRALVDALARDDFLAMYRGLVRNRLADVALKRLVRQGVLAKAWLGTGEEAVTVGPVHALNRTGARRDVVAPVIRNAGACYEMGMPVADVLRAYLGTADSPSRGRDGHCGDLARGVLPPISHLGDTVPVAAGIALSFQRRAAGAESRVVLAWIGDGAAKTGVAHEGLNFAAVRRLPVIFILQNNQVALGTRVDRHHLPARSPSAPGFADLPRAYGVWGGACDGNNVLDAYALTCLAVARCRRGEGPALLVADTFRMAGHATHDEAEARATLDPALFTHWGARDPIALYEEYLVSAGVTRETLAVAEEDVAAEVAAAEQDALASRRSRLPAGADAVDGVYATE